MKTRVPQALDTGILFYHSLVVKYGQLRELPVTENLWGWMSSILIVPAILHLLPFKNTLCFLLGVRKGQKTIPSVVGKFVHKTISGSILYQDWDCSKMLLKLFTEIELFCSFFSSFILFCWVFFTALYNISLMTHGLSDVFPNKTKTHEANLIIHWTS